MEAANWIFEHHNTPNGITISNTPNNNFQSPGSQSSQQFLNFDSPDGNSDISHANLSFTNSKALNINSNQNTPESHHTALNSRNEVFLHGESPIDILDPHHQQQQQQHQQQQQNQHQQQQQHQQSQQQNGAKLSEYHLQQHDKEAVGTWVPIPDLNDLEMNFFNNSLIINDDVQLQDHDDHHQIHNNNNHHNSKQAVPPTPQSFEVSMFHNAATDPNFLQNFQSPIIDQNVHNNSIRPDVVFTPLVSPAVTPMDAMINKNHHHPQQHSSFFSPLTSPALEAKSPMKLKKSSSPEESSSSSSSNNTTTTKKYQKRKTPGNTPIVGPTIPGRIAKQSPIIKAKRSTAYANTISYHHQQNSFTQQQMDDEVMAPPKTRRSKNSSQSNTTPATPATLMNFKFDSNQQQQELSQSQAQSKNGGTTSRSTSISQQSSSSPLINPENNGGDQQLHRTNSRNASTSKQKHSDIEDYDTSNPSSSKKTSHKLAEQGRRNRMNQAIQDLGYLIPEYLSSNVAIPSKATTVELACSYITSLSKENMYLKEKLKQFNFEIDSNESISPLETTNNHGGSGL